MVYLKGLLCAKTWQFNLSLIAQNRRTAIAGKSIDKTFMINSPRLRCHYQFCVMHIFTVKLL